MKRLVLLALFVGCGGNSAGLPGVDDGGDAGVDARSDARSDAGIGRCEPSGRVCLTDSDCGKVCKIGGGVCSLDEDCGACHDGTTCRVGGNSCHGTCRVAGVSCLIAADGTTDCPSPYHCQATKKACEGDKDCPAVLMCVGSGTTNYADNYAACISRVAGNVCPTGGTGTCALSPDGCFGDEACDGAACDMPTVGSCAMGTCAR